MEVVIALPFDPGDIRGVDQGHRVFFFAPANFLTSETVPVLFSMYQACAERWARAAATIAELQGNDEWQADLAWEKRVFRAHALCAASAWRYVQMGALRLARGMGNFDAAAERDRLVALFEAELADVEAFATMWRSDRRLLMNVNIRLVEFLQACYPWERIDPEDPFTTKLRHTRTMLAWLRDEANLDAVPCWDRSGA